MGFQGRISKVEPRKFTVGAIMKIVVLGPQEITGERVKASKGWRITLVAKTLLEPRGWGVGCGVWGVGSSFEERR